MTTYAKPLYADGTRTVPSLDLRTGKASNLVLHDWVACEQPSLLDGEEFNLIIKHTDKLYRVKSLDYEFADQDDPQIINMKLIREYLYNGTPANAMPDWSQYCELNLHPVNETKDDSGQGSCQIITFWDDADERLNKVSFWSIYGRLTEELGPGVDVIADFDEESEAYYVAALFSDQYGLPLVAPLVSPDAKVITGPLNVYDAEIKATITKSIPVIAGSDTIAVQKAHAYFSVLDDDTPENYRQETLSIKSVCDVL